MAEPVHPRVLVVIVGLMLGVILLLVGFFEQVSSRSQTPEISADPMHTITIVSATYGLNCVTGTPPANSLQALTGPAAAVLVPENNAVKSLAALCDGKIACQLNVTSRNVGFDPAPDCDKELAVTYRCFSYDTAHNISGHPDEEVKIDCSDNSRPSP